MSQYGVVPIDQAGNMVKSHEVISTTTRPESDTGLKNDLGEPIYETSQWLVLKNSTWTQAKIDEVEALGGKVLESPQAFQNWRDGALVSN